MALQDLATNLDDALSQLYAPKLVRAFNRASVLGSLLPKKIGRGKNIAWDVMFSGASAASYTDGADVSTYDVDTPVPATLSWGLYRSSFSVSGLAQAAAATSAGSAQELLDIIGTSIDNSAMKLSSTLNAAMFAGTGSGTTLTGLATALDNTGTYAGIARASYSEWQANVLSNGGSNRALTKALLDSLEADIFEACGFGPNAIVMTADLASKYESLFDAQTRVMLAPGNEISPMNPNGGAPGNIINPSGFTGFTYKGIPVYRDRDATANVVYMLNTEALHIEFLPQPQKTTASMSGNVQAMGSSATDMGLAFKLESVAKTGDADKFTMKAYLNLVVTRPNACGVLKDVA